MKVTYGIENADHDPSTIATLGSYDGLHLGHQDILWRLKQQKIERPFNRSLVITFDPHPQEILRKNNSTIQLLSTIDERLRLIAGCGIDETVVIPFSFEFSQTPYAEFFEQTLVNRLGVKAMVVGNNHAFGKNREGDLEHLEQLAQKLQIKITEVPPYVVDDVPISSTKIRHALLDGDIITATKYLGREYELSGTVVAGDKLGRELGFPTANIDSPKNKLIPKDGVYAGSVVTNTGITYKAAISIGTKPTITDSPERVIEALLLDFTGDLYGSTLTLLFDNYLREQIKFPSLDALKKQIQVDVDQVKSNQPF